MGYFPKVTQLVSDKASFFLLDASEITPFLFKGYQQKSTSFCPSQMLSEQYILRAWGIMTSAREQALVSLEMRFCAAERKR